jgi:phospholipid/cholesterol/gamma-HCH transport system substrate-binding protein
MRFSSSFKVGILTLTGLIILLFSILWVKGRSLSAGERMEIIFKDVNGMRAGSGVQMMGLRVGQVEEIIPVIEKDSSYVKLRFVITQKGLKIPRASTFSIQQSGLIGEQFLEITPPKIRTVYVPVYSDNNILLQNDNVELKMEKKYYDVGSVKNIQVISNQLVPILQRSKISTKYAYKVSYIIDLPGLILPDIMTGKIVSINGEKKLRLDTFDGTELPYPHQSSIYTVVEPMRISDFLDLQYKAAESLTETTLKVNEILSEDVIVELKDTIKNIKIVTGKASSTMDKAEKLLENSQGDLQKVMVMAEDVTNNFNQIAENVNNIIGDEKFKNDVMNTTESVGKLAKNLNNILDKTDSQKMAEDLQIIMRNLNDITTYVNTMTKDDKLKAQLMNTIKDVDKAMCELSNAMTVVNKMTKEQKAQIENIVSNTAVTTSNLRKFSEKLNKRFLLFRLMF